MMNYNGDAMLRHGVPDLVLSPGERYSGRGGVFLPFLPRYAAGVTFSGIARLNCTLPVRLSAVDAPAHPTIYE